MNKILIVLCVFAALACVAWGGFKLTDCKIDEIGIRSLSIHTTCKF